MSRGRRACLPRHRSTVLLTGCRRAEIGGAQWHEIDLDRAVWTIPAERSKNARLHALPLSRQALAIVRTQGATGPYVFGARGFTSWARCHSEFAERLGLPHWTTHDLRRSVATHLAEIGTPPHTLRRFWATLGTVLASAAFTTAAPTPLSSGRRYKGGPIIWTGLSSASLPTMSSSSADERGPAQVRVRRRLGNCRSRCRGDLPLPVARPHDWRRRAGAMPTAGQREAAGGRTVLDIRRRTVDREPSQAPVPRGCEACRHRPVHTFYTLRHNYISTLEGRSCQGGRRSLRHQLADDRDQLC